MQRLRSLLTRPLAIWLAVPLVIAAGLLLGITSATADQASTQPPLATPPAVTPAPITPSPTPRPEATASPTPRPKVQSVAGRIVQIELRNQAVVVQTRGNKFVTVFLQPATIVRLDGARVRPREMRAGDSVVVLARRAQFGTINAALITIKPRPPADG